MDDHCKYSEWHDGLDRSSMTSGMSLRDYFAAKAMAVLIEVNPIYDKDFEVFKAECATGAYAYADAMMKAREA